MAQAGWVELLRSLPPSLVESAVLNTVSGAEIALHSVTSVESDYLILRGRLTGTTDDAGFFLIPFECVNYVGFPKASNEAAFREQLAQARTASATFVPAPISAPAALADTPSVASVLGAPGPRIAAPAATPENGNAPVDKAALLERLRARRPTPEAIRPNEPQSFEWR